MRRRRRCSRTIRWIPRRCGDDCFFSRVSRSPRIVTVLGVVGLRLSWFRRVISYCYGARSGRSPWGGRVNVTVQRPRAAPWGGTPRVADSSAAGAATFMQHLPKRPPRQPPHMWQRSPVQSVATSQATLDRGDAFGTVHSNKPSDLARPRQSPRPTPGRCLNHGRRVLDRISVDEALSNRRGIVGATRASRWTSADARRRCRTRSTAPSRGSGELRRVR